MDFAYFKKKYQRQEVIHFPYNTSPHPVVSVIVQTYQHKDFIRACLNGILNQETDFPYEILLGEDASTDGTREICIEYAEKFPKKIRLFLHHPDNKIRILDTTTGNFNALYNFFSAKGEFIAFCEGDDIWTDPSKLQKQVDSLRSKKGLVLTYHFFREVNENEEAIDEADMMEQPKEDITKEDLKRLLFHPLLSTVCFRNIKEKNIPNGMAEVINVDSFLLSYLGNFGDAGFLDSISSSIYRRHYGGIWSGRSKIFKVRSKLLTFKKLALFYKVTHDKTLTSFFFKKFKKTRRALWYYKIMNWNLLKLNEVSRG